MCRVWGSKAEAESEVQPWGEEFRERARKEQRVGEKGKYREIE